MIVVTLGTEQYPFDSLLEWINILLKYEFISRSEQVIIQYGSSNKQKIGDFSQVITYDFLPEEKFKAYLKEARLVISHCGEGSAILLNSLKKPYILVPRAKRFGEHVDDHQLEMAEFLETLGVPIARCPSDLVKFLIEPISSNFLVQDDPNHWQTLLDQYDPQKYKKIMLVCSSGGHFKAMQELESFWRKFSDICWVTFRSTTTESEINSDKQRAYWAYSPTNRNLYNLFRNLFFAAKILIQEKPDLLISTGAGVAVPFFILAKLLNSKSKTLFIESTTRIKKLSLSAKILAKMSAIDKLVVQSEELVENCHNKNIEYVRSYYQNQSKNNEDNKLLTTMAGFEFLYTARNSLIILPPIVKIKEIKFVQIIQEKIEREQEKLIQRIILDMSQVVSCDTLALKKIYKLSSEANEKKIQLVLWGVSPKIRKYLKPRIFNYYFIVDYETLKVRRQEPKIDLVNVGTQAQTLQNSIWQEKINILDVSIDNLSKSEVLANVKQGIILHAGVEHLIHLHQNRCYLKTYNTANYILCNSLLVFYASRFLGTPLKEQVSQVDFFSAFCCYHKDNKNIKIFMLGSDPNLTLKAKNRINYRTCRQIIVAEYSPPTEFEKDKDECQKIITMINESKANVLVFAAENPAKEITLNQAFINKYKPQMNNINIIISVGNAIDFEAENCRKIPQWIKYIGLEWLYSWISAPKGLWKKHLVDNILFLGWIVRQKLKDYKTTVQTKHYSGSDSS